MGNNCVGSRVVSNDGCFHSITNSLWRSRATTDGVNPCTSGDGVLSESALVVIQHNPLEQIKVVKEETKSIKSKIVKGQTDSAQGKVMKEEVKPVHPSRPDQEPQTVKRVVSQIKYVLETKTGRLHEYYNLGRKLGQGQYGTTYLCVEKATGKKYACKSLMKKEHLTEDDVVNVRNEIQILHHLSGHKHIIGIKDAYEDAEAVHVVMEFCAGGELFDRIKKRGHYTERKAAQLARTIVGSVEACHSLGVMHRDLKPENFLFLNEHEDSPLKTIDFGLSVFFKPGETFTKVVGSPTYVAPEVLSKCYGPEADVWSAGVIIYILLSGLPPFWGETKEKTFEQILHGDLNLSSDPWPNISASAKDLVRRMLIRDPKKRITAPEVLCHPWVQVDEVDSAVLSRLKQFSAMNYLKKMALKKIWTYSVHDPGKNF